MVPFVPEKHRIRYGTRVRKEEPMIAVYADHRGIQHLIEAQPGRDPEISP